MTTCLQLPKSTDQQHQGLCYCSEIWQRATGQKGNTALVAFTFGAPKEADFYSAVAKDEQKQSQLFSSKLK